MENYIDVRRYLDADKKNLIKVYLDNEDIKYLIINSKGNIIDTGEQIINYSKVKLKDGRTITKEEVAGKEQTTFFNSDTDIKSINIGEEPLIRHKGAKDEVTRWVNILYPITKIEKYIQ
jgi:hypothetical protein